MFNFPGDVSFYTYSNLGVFNPSQLPIYFTIQNIITEKKGIIESITDNSNLLS